MLLRLPVFLNVFVNCFREWRFVIALALGGLKQHPAVTSRKCCECAVCAGPGFFWLRVPRRHSHLRAWLPYTPAKGAVARRSLFPTARAPRAAGASAVAPSRLPGGDGGCVVCQDPARRANAAIAGLSCLWPRLALLWKGTAWAWWR